MSESTRLPGGTQEALNRWWDEEPSERYWLEITDREDLGADLHAPKLDDAGRPYWSYNLVTEVRADDVVLHWHKSMLGYPAIVGWSVATGVPEDSSIVWQARGSFGRRHGPTGPEPAWRMPLRDYTPLLSPIGQATLRREEGAVRTVHDDLVGRFRRPLYFPFALSERRPVRTAQGYLVKFPSALVQVFEELASLPTATPRSRPSRTTPRPVPGRGGAGYQSDFRVRSAIETHAVDRAVGYFAELGYEVENVGAFESFDLLVKKDSELRHVEVKGSSGDAVTVELTDGEVRHARRHQPTDLYVVDGIAWRRQPDGSIATSGGNDRVLHDWMPGSEDLSATRYRYRLPEHS
ncbi:protein NO VEIN domain-containing protein [Geodermatophilus sp. CPCC 205506]|uniref:protein NO VEIN domain-containing protein n=1 Tax=Geodermatophilus sp. CPCC 205506 TaxID=2936596 RepID=UPI003EEF7B20